MPPHPEVPDALRGKVFRGSTVTRLGLLSAGQLRSSAWQRVRRDVYADAALPADHGLAVVAAALVLPRRGAIAGRSAAWLHGIKQAAPTDPVDVLLPAAKSWWSAKGVAAHVQDVADHDLAIFGRRRMTNPDRTCVDIARWYDPVVAVPLIDALLASRLVTQPGLAEQLGLAQGWGVGQAERTLALCDARAESPPESALRVRLILAGMPAPVPQYEVWLNGRFIARVDLAWPEMKIAVEYDGAWHGAAGQFGKDRRRLNALVAAGWTVIHVTAADMHNLTSVIAQLRTILRQSA